MDGWIATRHGHKVRPLDLDPDEVDIRDIAHALSNLCRFTGHTPVLYSVAQHSILVASYVVPEHRLAALLHDASEAYLCDLARPMKRLPEFAFYREAEDRAMGVIAKKFGFAWPMAPEVEAADLLLLATEGRDLMPARYADWDIKPPQYPVLDLEIQPWDAALVKNVFLWAFVKLTEGDRGSIPSHFQHALPRCVRWIFDGNTREVSVGAQELLDRLRRNQ